MSNKEVSSPKSSQKAILVSAKNDTFYQFSLKHKTWSELNFPSGKEITYGTFEINKNCYFVCRDEIFKIPSTQHFYKLHPSLKILNACRFKDQILLFGSSGKGFLFNPINKQLSTTNINVERYYFTAVEYLDKVWITGEFEFHSLASCKKLNTIQIYDPSNKTTSLSPIEMIQARSHHKLIVYKNKLFVFGGFSIGIGILNSVEMYSPETKKFITMAPMKIPRYDFACCRVGNFVYVIGGFVDDMQSCTTSVEIYNLDTDAWTFGEDFPVVESFLHACAISNKLNNIKLNI